MQVALEALFGPQHFPQEHRFRDPLGDELYFHPQYPRPKPKKKKRPPKKSNKIHIPYSDLVREAMLRDYPRHKVKKIPMGKSGQPAQRPHRYSKGTKPADPDNPTKLERSRARNSKRRHRRVNVSESPQR